MDFPFECCGGVTGADNDVRVVAPDAVGEDAATRRCVVQGEEQWSVIDRAVTWGTECGQWWLEDTIWAEVPGDGADVVSDHALLVFQRETAWEGKDVVAGYSGKQAQPVSVLLCAVVSLVHPSLSAPVGCNMPIPFY